MTTSRLKIGFPKGEVIMRESRLVDEGYRTLPFPFDEHGDSQRDAGENRGALAVIPRQLP